MNQNNPLMHTDREAYHGGIDPRELSRYGIEIEDVIDFSSNILPHGPSTKVIAAIASAAIGRYPDRESDDLKTAISEFYSVNRGRLLIGGGCSELIHLVANTLLKPGDQALVLGPTFSEYSRATRLALAKVENCDASESNNFAVPYSLIDERLDSKRFKMVWVCNPNNPTAQVISSGRLISWLNRHPETWFVVDESYIDFSEQAESMLPNLHANLIVLRSMTKTFAIPGVRLGFAALSQEACELLRSRRVPWNVSSPAQAAGVAAIGDINYYQSALREVRESKTRLINDLKSAGFNTIDGDTNFFLLKIDNGRSLRENLFRKGMAVRDCTSFGLNDYVRIASHSGSNNRRLVHALVDQEHGDESWKYRDKTKKPPQFDAAFTTQLNELFRKRRDVRRFRREPIENDALQRWIQAACLAPSVGLSQPWRFISVRSPSAKLAVTQEFELQNKLAAESYQDAAVADKYRDLKLAGLYEAPEHLAVFVEPFPQRGGGLGRSTMPESVTYSVVAAIQNLWLAAKAEGVGVGWVSILRPERVKTILNVPNTWQLIAYLCIGWPQIEDDEVPELEKVGWEERVTIQSIWTQC